MNSSIVLLKQLSDQLIDEHSTWIERKDCLEAMHQLFVELGALNLRDDNMRSAAAVVAGGVAIAPTWAGMCLFDIARTRQFVLGLKEAIADQLLHHPLQPVQVLDAGCGPYGLLSLLCACYFPFHKVQFTLLDIFPANIESTRTLIKALQMEPHFTEVVVADALTYTWPAEKDLNILLTETMNTALCKEPQVAITLHLSKQLAKRGVLIPASIEVSVGRQFHQQPTEQQQPLGNDEIPGLVMRLDKHTTKEDIAKRPLVTVSLPDTVDVRTDRLQFFTHIHIYKHVQLASNESAITLPKSVKLLPDFLQAKQRNISFYYKMDNEPGIQQYFSS